MYTIESIKESIVVHLAIRTSFDILNDALVHHCERVNVKSPARHLLKGYISTNCVNFSDEEVLIIYTVDGITTNVGDPQIFILDRCTMENHRVHASTRRTIHYVVLLCRNRAFELVGDNKRELHIINMDANPKNAVLVNNSSSMRILTRTSTPLMLASSVLETAERGQVVVDTDGALTQCCAWLVETIEIIEDGFDQKLSVTNGCTLDVIEAYLWQHTSFSVLHNYVNATTSIFLKIEELVATNSIVALQWKEKKAMLQNRMNNAFYEATWCSLLSRHSLTLKIQDPAKSQSMDNVDRALESLFYGLLTVFVTFPGNNVTSCDSFLHYLEKRLITQISSDLVGKCESLLSLPNVFSVDNPKVPKAPRCTNEAIQALFRAAVHSLNAWAASWNRLVTILTACFVTRISSTPGNSIAAVEYASKRCSDLLDMIYKIDKVSHGVLTPEAVCLYSSMRTAASTFRMLRSSEEKNWKLFQDNFQKTLILRYTAEETVRYQQESDIEPQTPPDRQRRPKYQATTIYDISGVTTITEATEAPCVSHNQSSMTRFGVTGAETSGLLEEREILRSRVTVMAKDISECRELIASLQEQLARKTQNLETAQDLNISLLSEIKRLQLLVTPNTRIRDDSPYNIILSRNDLIAQLAVNEECRHKECLSVCRNIEDDILDEN